MLIDPCYSTLTTVHDCHQSDVSKYSEKYLSPVLDRMANRADLIGLIWFYSVCPDLDVPNGMFDFYMVEIIL